MLRPGIDWIWAKISQPASASPLTSSEAEVLAAVLGEKLGSALSIELDIDQDTISLEGGDMSATARSRGTFCGLLMLEVIAHMFVSRIAEGKIAVSAVVFLFGGGKRLTASDGGELLSLQLDPYAGVSATWQSIGWGADEYGEWKDLSHVD